MKNLRRVFAVVLCVVVGCVVILINGCAGGNYIQTDKKLPTREKVTVELEIYEPKNIQEAKGVVLMFPGGGGAISGVNFVVRTTPQFVEQGYIVVIMGLSSDSFNMDIESRKSPKHQEDIKKVIKYVNDRYNQKPLFIAGFSLSNLSLAYLSVMHTDLNSKGMIFMSGIWEGSIDAGVIDRFAKIPYNVLLVHHENDGCASCLYKGAKKYYNLLETKGRKDFVTVNGGYLTVRLGSECGPYHYHGFEGREKEVVKVVVDWMDGKEIPKEIK